MSQTAKTKSKNNAPWRRRWRGRLGLAALALAGAAGWLYWHRPAPPPAPPSAIVSLADVTQTVQAGGVLQARTRVEVGAQVSGQIQALHVQLGQAVKKGELLVSLDPELARSDVAQAEAALAQQRAMLDGRQIDLQTAKRELARQQRLLAGQATAATEAERAETELAKLEADVRGQTATVARLQADLANRQLRLGYTRISAPMDGTVVNLPVQEGQTVIAVQVTPVMLTLANLDTITVRARVPEADIQAIQVGQLARFNTLAGEGKRYEGRVRVIQPIPERTGNAVFYNVLFEVENRDRKLFSDMTVQVDIETGSARQVLSIPTVALGERGKDGRYTVQLLDATNKQTPRQVRVGLQDGARVQVLEGLKAGDKVLLAPPSAEAAASAASSGAG
ncbi:efflux RND transporter periplasmic adaptor subunit [Paucibacter soli]|uniref:efflux RND transporter periplasmic adaptor subunit n=1 Tax=Paucibacter soli TaxID=3133433 RepID=UPI00309F3684